MCPWSGGSSVSELVTNSPSQISSSSSTSGPAAEPAGALEEVELNGFRSKLDFPYKFDEISF